MKLVLFSLNALLEKKLVIYSNKKQLRNYARVYCIVRSYDPIT